MQNILLNQADLIDIQMTSHDDGDLVTSETFARTSSAAKQQKVRTPFELIEAMLANQPTEQSTVEEAH